MAGSDCNVFQFCKCLRLLGNVMILVVLGLVALSYYPIVVTIYGPAMFDQNISPVKEVAAIFVVASFHVLAALMLWSYFAAILTCPGHVPDDFRPDVDPEENPEAMSDKSDPRRPRFCRKCQKWKPERTHHCSICGRCVLKMDHHCVWVMNCVGERNYKFFFLFLWHTFLLSLLSVLALLPYFSEFFKGERNADKGSNPAQLAVSFMAFVVDLAFCLSLFGFIVMHLKLIAANCTTIEMFEKERIKPWPYDKGVKKNFEEVFGTSKLLWFVPVQRDQACTNEERLRLRM
ncbi:putative S-acyltransferase [Chloropicon primus]|uniref:S-acyltransferase n=1 Tax=Chloropicon primus TaxID=1764295 RepID=A0A5B8MBT4_9CHLO|nr:putative S-acyltransferase [Chloropicon primus]UPQ96789.1 putative S-acyltransferase [Chloropicon primus]|eukprot:QDZ17571.1 putative S-acyltransferase [Chloropicon primus]